MKKNDTKEFIRKQIQSLINDSAKSDDARLSHVIQSIPKEKQTYTIIKQIFDCVYDKENHIYGMINHSALDNLDHDNLRCLVVDNHHYALVILEWLMSFINHNIV